MGKKRRGLSRRQIRDIRNGQYEFPGIKAGMVWAGIGEAVELIREHLHRHGEAPLLESALRILMRARETSREWQAMAQMITDYEYAREIVLGEEDE